MNKEARKTIQMVVLCCALVNFAAKAQTFTTIKSLGTLPDVTGINPYCQLVQGPDGTLYGTASHGAGGVQGTVFKIQPNGSGFTLLKSFTNSLEGANPYAGLTLTGSVLYGTTVYGGASNVGTVFRINTDGTGYTVLKHFFRYDGVNPFAPLTLDGSTLFGATGFGGTTNLGGTVFKMNTNGTGHTLLKNYTNYTSVEGAFPNARLTLSGSVLYGTTLNGGTSNLGTIFQMSADGGDFKLLKNFEGGGDGGNAFAGLTLSGSVFYGVTQVGGSSNFGTVFRMNTNGTGYTVLKNFTGSDGQTPLGTLALVGSVLYGTTYSGGSSNFGTLFQVNIDGSGFKVIKDFTGSDGAYPFAGPTLFGSTLYGTTYSGGSMDGGTLFKLDLSIPLAIQPQGNAIVLSWDDPGFALESAPAATGVYTNVPDTSTSYTTSPSDLTRFFRLKLKGQVILREVEHCLRAAEDHSGAIPKTR